MLNWRNVGLGSCFITRYVVTLSCDERISSRKGGDSNQNYTYSLMINKLERGNDSLDGGTDTIDFITSTLRQHSRLIFQVEGLWVSQYDASLDNLPFLSWNHRYALD